MIHLAVSAYKGQAMHAACMTGGQRTITTRVSAVTCPDCARVVRAKEAK